MISNLHNVNGIEAVTTPGVTAVEDKKGCCAKGGCNGKNKKVEKPPSHVVAFNLFEEPTTENINNNKIVVVERIYSDNSIHQIKYDTTNANVHDFLLQEIGRIQAGLDEKEQALANYLLQEQHLIATKKTTTEQLSQRKKQLRQIICYRNNIFLL